MKNYHNISDRHAVIEARRLLGHFDHNAPKEVVRVIRDYATSGIPGPLEMRGKLRHGSHAHILLVSIKEAVSKAQQLHTNFASCHWGLTPKQVQDLGSSYEFKRLEQVAREIAEITNPVAESL